VGRLGPIAPQTSQRGSLSHPEGLCNSLRRIRQSSRRRPSSSDSVVVAAPQRTVEFPDGCRSLAAATDSPSTSRTRVGQRGPGFHIVTEQRGDRLFRNFGARRCRAANAYVLTTRLVLVSMNDRLHRDESGWSGRTEQGTLGEFEQKRGDVVRGESLPGEELIERFEAAQQPQRLDSFLDRAAGS